MSDYNDGLWHGWNGGECPVHPESRIQWTRRVGSGALSMSHQGECPARSARWINFADEPHINAFRVVKVHREPREFWVKTDWDGRLSECASALPGAFIVREVIE